MSVRKKYNKLITLINDNYAWFIATSTFLGVIISHIFKFFEYIAASFFFSYYGLDIDLYKYNDQNFIYSLCVSIIFYSSLVSILFTANKLVENLHNKINCNILKRLAWVLFYNLFFSYITLGFNYIFSYVIYNIILLFIEMLYSYLIFNDDDKISELELKEQTKNYFKTFPILVIFIIMLYGGRIYSRLELNKSYNIIDDNKVIVYSTYDYYLTLDCEIDDKNNELIIYKDRQEKINNNNVKSQLTKFDKVERK